MLNRIVDIISFLITWALLVAAVGGIALGLYVYNRADNEIRAYVESTLAEHYAPLSVSLKSARILERRGIELRGLSIRDTSVKGDEVELVFVDSINVACEPTLDDLMHGKLCVRRVTVSHPRFRLACDAQGQWQLGRLVAPPAFCGVSRPTLKVVNGTAEIHDARRQSQYTLRDIELTARQLVQPSQPQTSAASLSQSQPRPPESPLPVTANDPPSTSPAGSECQLPWLQSTGPRLFQLAASFTGDHLEHTVINGTVQPDENIWRFVGNVPRVHLSPELRQSLPLEVAHYLNLVPTLRSGGSFRFDVSHHPERTPAMQYEIDGQLSDGRMDDPRFTFPVTDLQASIRFTNEGLWVKPITGRYGESNLQLTCQRDGHTPDSTWLLHGNVERLRIDPNLASALPPTMQHAWQGFQPNGLIDAKFQLSFDGLRWQVHHVNVSCREMSVLARMFPYPLNDVNGDVRWHKNHASFDLRAAASGQPVIVRGEIDSPGPDWTGWITGRTDGRIALDDTLVAALRPTIQSVVRKFGAQGWLTAQAEFRRETAVAPIEKQLAIDLTDTYIRHAAFPYPLQDVQGRILMANDMWEFQDLRGKNDTAQVTCHGSLTPHPAGNVLRLDFGVTDLPLDDEVRLALPEQPQAIWKQLRPYGQLDQMSATVEKVGDADINVHVAIQEAPAPQGSLAPSLSIHPVTFPYRIDQLTGNARFANGQFQFDRVRGSHGSAGLFIAQGSGTTSDDGQWQIRLENFSADQLNIDHDFLAAVPPRLNKQLIQSHATGPFSVQGAIAFAGHRDEPRNVRSAWDLAVDLDDTNLTVGVNAEHVSGTVRMTGGSDIENFYSQGTLEIDSLMIRDVHVTQLRGPIWVDQDRVLFGRLAQPDGTDQPPQQLAAQLLGGQIACDGQSQLDTQGLFQVQMQLKDVQTNELLRIVDTRPSIAAGATPNSLTPNIDGQTVANLALSGTRQGRHTLQGTGVVQLKKANLYELPFILSLVRTLRSGSVDRTAFDEADMQFRVQGDHVYFDKLDLIGDGIALKGVGEMSGRQDLNLDFYTILGKRNAYLNSIRPVLGIPSSRFLQINVAGTVSEPIMTREVLPGLNDTLERLFPEAATASVKRDDVMAKTHPGAGILRR